MKRKEQLNESDDDADVVVDDVENMLNKHEQTMKTMRLEEEVRKSQESIKAKVSEIAVYNAENVVYQQVDSPNNIDVSYNQRISMEELNEHLEDEEDESSSSDEMPLGRLAVRIEFIKRKCIDGMQLDGFRIAYNLMKKLQYQDKSEALIADKIEQLCNLNGQKVSKSRVNKYKSLIDQLLFIEANCS